MNSTTSTTLETELERAHLLCLRRQFDEAQRILFDLNRRYPGNPDVQNLLARIRATEQADKQENERLRGWRYTLHLDTLWRRVGWFLAGLGLLIYGLWGGTGSLHTGRKQGFNTTITTRMYSKRGSYDWTRPVYYDVVYNGFCILLGTTAMGVVLIVGRGAAQWEELNASNPDGRAPWW